MQITACQFNLKWHFAELTKNLTIYAPLHWNYVVNNIEEPGEEPKKQLKGFKIFVMERYISLMFVFVPSLAQEMLTSLLK